MIGVSIAAQKEWEVILKKFNVSNCDQYPFGEYFVFKIFEETIIFYKCGVRKVKCSAATQYMIDHYNLKKVIVIGTCAGIDDKYKDLDIIIPNKLVQYDCTVKEMEPFIKDSFTILLDLDNLSIDYNTGTIGTADKAVVMWKDYLELKDNQITVADTESAAIAFICKLNNVECIVIKGISDFPTNESITAKNESYNSQLNNFINNIPSIMNNIVDNYLEIAIKCTIKYK